MSQISQPDHSQPIEGSHDPIASVIWNMQINWAYDDPFPSTRPVAAVRYEVVNVFKLVRNGGFYDSIDTFLCARREFLWNKVRSQFQVELLGKVFQFGATITQLVPGDIYQVKFGCACKTRTRC